MVQFMTLEDRLDGDIQMRNQENETVKNLVLEMEHSKDCTTPQIQIVYETSNAQEKVSATYENGTKKMIAGCTCGAKTEVEVKGHVVDASLKQPSYSGSMEDKNSDGNYAVAFSEEPKALAYY